MHFSIPADRLRDALNKILSVVDKKNSRPISNHCLTEIRTDSLELVATDLEVAAKVKVEANISETGKFCIQARSLFEILKEMPSDIVQFEMNNEENILRISCQEIKFSLLVSNSDEFPFLAFQSKTNSFTILSKDLQKIINKTSFAMSVDETRPFLNGLFLQKINSKLRAVATDGHRLALFDAFHFDKENPILDEGVIIPRKGVSEIKKLADAHPEAELQISVDESFIYVNAGDKHYLSIRLISREFPNYQAVIPSKTTFSMYVDRSILLTAVKRVKILANERSNGIKLILRHNELTVFATHPSLGDASEKIHVEYVGNEIEIGINAKYLVDSLSILNDGLISFEFNNELGPTIIKSEQIPQFLGIIMPLKL